MCMRVHTHTHMHICFIVGVYAFLRNRCLHICQGNDFLCFLLNPYSLNSAFISTIYLELILVLDVKRDQNPFLPL